MYALVVFVFDVLGDWSCVSLRALLRVPRQHTRTSLSRASTCGHTRNTHTPLTHTHNAPHTHRHTHSHTHKQTCKHAHACTHIHNHKHPPTHSLSPLFSRIPGKHGFNPELAKLARTHGNVHIVTRQNPKNLATHTHTPTQPMSMDIVRKPNASRLKSIRIILTSC